jgi:hypothetical protein
MALRMPIVVCVSLVHFKHLLTNGQELASGIASPDQAPMSLIAQLYQLEQMVDEHSDVRYLCSGNFD